MNTYTMNGVIVLFHSSSVLRIHFASKSFSGKENENIMITIVMTGGTVDSSIFIGISFSELTAKS